MLSRAKKANKIHCIYVPVAQVYSLQNLNKINKDDSVLVLCFNPYNSYILQRSAQQK